MKEKAWKRIQRAKQTQTEEKKAEEGKDEGEEKKHRKRFTENARLQHKRRKREP